MGGGASSQTKQGSPEKGPSAPPGASDKSPQHESPARGTNQHLPRGNSKTSPPGDSNAFPREMTEDSPVLSPRASLRSPRGERQPVARTLTDRSQCSSKRSMYEDQEEEDQEEAAGDGYSDGVNEENMNSLVYSAMSLGMDNDELLFNMFYFGDEGGSGFRQSMNTAIEETYAAHSTGNTPYKLKPATEDSIQHHLTADVDMSGIADSEECLICQEKLKDSDQSIVMISACKHIFHEECVKRWFTLQNWCPICRTVISSEAVTESKATGGIEAGFDADTCHTHSSSLDTASDCCGGTVMPRAFGGNTARALTYG